MKYGQNNAYQLQVNNQSIYNPSTHLYQPLRAALKDYRRLPQQLYKPNPDNNYLKNSKVTKTNRSLTSSEAQNIKASIVFPQNKTLIPTNNLKRIEGKTFVTVGVKQKMKDPISYHEFLRIKNDGHQEIVYQIQQEDEMNKVFTYTTTNTTKNTLPTSNTQPSLPKLPEPKLYSKLKSPVETSLGVRSKNLSQENENKGDGKQLDYQSYYKQQYQGSNVDPRNFQKVSGPIMEMPSFIDTLPRKFSYSYNQAEDQLIIQPSQLKNYTFKKENLKKYQQFGKSQIIQNRLNLFNMLDECGSRGCSFKACKSNEICASRISKEYWK